jgi:hypothetical protein
MRPVELGESFQKKWPSCFLYSAQPALGESDKIALQKGKPAIISFYWLWCGNYIPGNTFMI